MTEQDSDKKFPRYRGVKELSSWEVDVVAYCLANWPDNAADAAIIRDILNLRVGASKVTPALGSPINAWPLAYRGGAAEQVRKRERAHHFSDKLFYGLRKAFEEGLKAQLEKAATDAGDPTNGELYWRSVQPYYGQNQYTQRK